MDDHMYDQMMDYAKAELIPRFQKEYIEYKRVKDCPSYEEIKDLCIALNAVAKWAGYSKKTPLFFCKWMKRFEENDIV